MYWKTAVSERTAKQMCIRDRIKENALNKPVIGIFEKYANTHADFQMYIITAPLGEKYDNFNYSSYIWSRAIYKEVFDINNVARCV